MDFFEQTGKVAIGSRLRMLTDKVTEDAANIYQLYNIDMQPKWFPVFYSLSQGEEKTITELAKLIGHSHPSVSKMIGEMLKKGYVKESRDKEDGRRNVISLSDAGKQVADKIKDQLIDVEAAIEELSAQTQNKLWEAIGEWEFLLEQKNLLRRVMEKKKERDSLKVEIIDYQPKYQEIFRSLNVEWISKYFTMEESDYKALDNPQGYILDKGGVILVARYEGEPLGVCALIKMNDGEYDFELAKMAVSPKAQGKNVGFLLANAIIEKARSLSATKIYLESNTILKPAINLYHKLGFKKVAGKPTPYARCNIQMELVLK
ncbi:bifunctional helix-turn-helix transcriptional regulator/GNAT family N-acetyltransferase [Pedobacter zeae]|uniref:MarR family transcriptional regulator n=1 Tax=Pedobacter zeae TaxID=1737356 RepID=A0A7W6K7S9_9SPHI|nr:bifunctional helix-turn-helix transcriptional regulator/GNAT family N-acetyltransferase [Pedobacter zeae]MBB4106785.1 DNA-binding MarR family transcriptional regulator/GNAT superfamily N-acetyltransferase [Pedobacter zeae]GGH03721.1 MarR family transcriptional regulator [Pedobacter zeae]